MTRTALKVMCSKGCGRVISRVPGSNGNWECQPCKDERKGRYAKLRYIVMSKLLDARVKQMRKRGETVLSVLKRIHKQS